MVSFPNVEWFRSGAFALAMSPALRRQGLFPLARLY
jgi:hypothetical protein